MNAVPDFSAPPPARRLVREPTECRSPIELGMRLADAIPETGPDGRITMTREALSSLLAAAAEFGTSAGLRMKETSR